MCMVLFFTVPSGDVHQYDGCCWHKIGGPGYKFGANKDVLVGISPNKDSVWAFLNGHWTKVGGPVFDIIVGPHQVFGINPCTRDIYK